MPLPRLERSKADAGQESVCLSYIHPSDLSAYFHDSIVEMLVWDIQHHHQIKERISVFSGPRIASARNAVVKEFLSSRRSEWLVMVDADMVFAVDTIERLIEGARQENALIVGSLCYGSTATGIMNPTLFRLVEDEGGKRMERYDDLPPKGMAKVDATGTGFIIMHRDALTAIGETFYDKDAWPWFSEGSMRYNEQFREYGEDVGFCLRARVLGIDVWVNTAVEVLHAKTRIVGSKEYRRFRKEEKSGLSEYDRQRYFLPYNFDPEELDRG